MLLKQNDYYTQRNNKFAPFESCMNTTRVMLYKALGIEYMKSTKYSDDDYFYRLLDSNQAKEFRDKRFPTMKDVHPTQIHGMYKWLDVMVIGRRITDFQTDLTWDDFVHQVKIGHPVMTSGKFPNLDGHAFLVCGFKNGELQLADPWGDYRLGYKGNRGTRGYDVRMNREDFEKYVKPGQSKWGHIVC